MRRTTFALLLAFAPAALAAQSEPGPTESKPAAPSAAPSGFSAETRVRLEAMFQVARERNLPTQPMADRVAEGQAKGASEAQIVAATRQLQAQLTASQEALIRAGRTQPSDAEVTRGAQLIARGATSAQLETLARQEPSEHRLEVAIQVLTDLAARGIPVDHALSVLSGLNGSAGAQVSRGNGSEPAGASLTGAVGGRVGVGLTRKP